jgi:hypothetical protein
MAHFWLQATCGGHHHAGINPVVEVRTPSDDELSDAGVLEKPILGQNRLLSVVVTGTGAGIELGNFGVGHRRGQAEQEGGKDTEPHGGSGCAGGGLDIES